MDWNGSSRGTRGLVMSQATIGSRDTPGAEMTADHEFSRASYDRGCRCPGCGAAKRARDNERARQIAYGRWHPFVDAQRARDHIQQVLSPAGIGWKRTAQLAGLSPGIITRLLYGGGRHQPSQRIRPATEAAILAVRPGQPLADGARVDAAGTHRRVQALVAREWSQARIAAELGMARNNLSVVMRESLVTAGMAGRVKDVYDRLWNAEPPASTAAERGERTRARRVAERGGWAPPGAWDEDQIDDPAGRPAAGWRRSAQQRSADLAAEWHELEAQGCDKRQAAERMGVKHGTLNTAIARAGRQQAAAAAGAAARPQLTAVPDFKPEPETEASWDPGLDVEAG